MGGGGYPPDNSAKMAQIEADRAREERRAEEKRRQEERDRFVANLDAAVGAATSSANQFFSSRGLDPSQYEGSIQDAIASRRGTVPDLDPSPGSYFSGLGQGVYDDLTTADQAKFQRAFDSFAPAGFAERRITNDLDDPIISGLIEEQYASSDDYIRNLLDRGVITDTGYQAAIGDLDKQRPGADARLQELGLGILEGGRADLRDIASSGRQAAANYTLGSQFDPYSYEGDINRAYEDFFTGLSNTFRAQAPKNIFDTAGLAGIAGAAQGAQNTTFDPKALAGLNAGEEEDDEEENRQDDNIF